MALLNPGFEAIFSVRSELGIDLHAVAKVGTMFLSTDARRRIWR